MDWRAYHAVNRFVSEHAWLGQLFRGIETYGTILLAVATVLLWLLARPGSDRKWKLAAASGLVSAGLALAVNSVVASIWHRSRPFVAHRVAHIWGPRKTDASFPSDHASAAFAIASAVFLFDRLVGSLFLAAAALIAAGRLIVGEHYPLDVIAGLFVGAGCAVLVVTLGRPVVAWLVRLVDRLSDPILRAVWRR
jgi:undecaprenyl-diphosphatase